MCFEELFFLECRTNIGEVMLALLEQITVHVIGEMSEKHRSLFFSKVKQSTFIQFCITQSQLIKTVSPATQQFLKELVT